MIKSKFTLVLFVISMLLGGAAAQAACSTCVPTGPIEWEPDDPWATYSATVSYITWSYNRYGQYVHTVNYLTLTGDTMAYCQQQLSAATASPGVSVVQFCQKD